MKVRRVMVLAPIRSRMDPNLGMDSAMKRSKSMTQVRKTHRFQLKSEQEKAEKCPFLNEGSMSYRCLYWSQMLAGCILLYLK